MGRERSGGGACLSEAETGEPKGGRQGQASLEVVRELFKELLPEFQDDAAVMEAMREEILSRTPPLGQGAPGERAVAKGGGDVDVEVGGGG